MFLKKINDRLKMLEGKVSPNRSLIIKEYDNGFLLIDETNNMATTEFVINDGSRRGTYSRLLYEIAERFGCNRDETREDNIKITFDSKGIKVKE